ncbi:hypothetical protein Q1695_012807 [Nippostrongylus brasiliensis]|nr:hypothetical protein Q1695_012807 [Nippostrongylus brasiliensis]
MTCIRTLMILSLMLLAFPTFVVPLFIIRKLSTTTYHDNPAISPLNIMNTNPTFLRMDARRLPDLPESYSPSEKRFYFSDSSLQAMRGRYPMFY